MPSNLHCHNSKDNNCTNKYYQYANKIMWITIRDAIVRHKYGLHNKLMDKSKESKLTPCLPMKRSLKA